jgi:hypothetical protein
MRWTAKAFVDTILKREGFKIMNGRRERAHSIIISWKVAPTDAHNYMGANGTGKELVAHWLHENQRSKGPSSRWCAAIPSELIESELFGHVKEALREQRPCWGNLRLQTAFSIFLDDRRYEFKRSGQGASNTTRKQNTVVSDGICAVDIRVSLLLLTRTWNRKLRKAIPRGFVPRACCYLLNVPSPTSAEKTYRSLIKHLQLKCHRTRS